jgi:hypothetical protein
VNPIHPDPKPNTNKLSALAHSCGSKSNRSLTFRSLWQQRLPLGPKETDIALCPSFEATLPSFPCLAYTRLTGVIQACSTAFGTGAKGAAEAPSAASGPCAEGCERHFAFVLSGLSWHCALPTSVAARCLRSNP